MGLCDLGLVWILRSRSRFATVSPKGKSIGDEGIEGRIIVACAVVPGAT